MSSSDTDGSSGGGNEWCTIESDPGVFTELLENLGCKTVELEELYTLDDDSIEQLQKESSVYGLIFLFKWQGRKQHDEYAQQKTPLSEDEIPSDLFFAHQVTTNACATQAILSVVFNAGLPEDELGTTLAAFHSFTSSFPPSLKGTAISSSEEIRTAHNAFSPQDAFLREGKFHLPTEKDEAYHFIAYVPHVATKTVYELDGLQSGPIVVGTYETDDKPTDAAAADDDAAATDGRDKSNDATNWILVARQAIQERMTAGGDHVKFNLMAVIQDKRVRIQQQLEAASSSNSDAKEDGDTARNKPSPDMLVAQLEAENAKREQWKFENQRRRHNYVPLAVQLLKELARLGTLPTYISQAKERVAAKRQKMMEKKQAA